MEIVAAELPGSADVVVTEDAGTSVKTNVTDGSWWQNPLISDVADEIPVAGQFDFVARDATILRASG